MFLVYDNITNNVLDEFDTFHEAEQRRIQVIGANPHLAEAIQVVDLDATVARYRVEVETRDAQPA
ncbi:MAG: hypothetical protein M5U27_09630 [Gaiella sp.]|nr:hypothetical protein [Gaiella sp.]